MKKKYNILLAEDNEDHAELVIRGITDYSEDIIIDHVWNGEEVFEFLEAREVLSPESKNFPDVILLDLRMPKMDGLEVLQKLKSDDKFKVIPVVILSTSSAVPDIKEAYNSYVNSYLVKPIDFHEFETLMQRLGLYWLTQNKTLNN